MRYRFFLIAALTALALTASGCRSCNNGGGGGNNNGNTLPAQVPPSSNIEYVKSDGGLPPKVKDATDIQQIEVIETQTITKEQLIEFDTLARSNDALRAQLGERASLLNSYYIDSGKDEPAKQILSLTYYSYSNNYAVQVLIDDKRMVKNEIVREYQPPASNAEIEEAVAVALRNQEIRAAAGQLRAQGIVTYRKFENREIQNHRILYISFSKKEKDNIEYFAYVDMIRMVVIEHGKDVESRPDESFKNEYLRRK